MPASTAISMDMANHAFTLPGNPVPEPSPPQDTSEPAISQTGEKRRNKLGYHRTSVACGHCRRRKIRCIPSAELPARCINCIRLKKECSFHPVDQTPSESRAGSGSKARRSSPSETSVSTASTASHASYPTLGGLPMNAMARASSISNSGVFYSTTGGADSQWSSMSQGSSTANNGSVAYDATATPSTYNTAATWNDIAAVSSDTSANGWMSITGARGLSINSDSPFDRRASMMSEYASSVSDASMGAHTYEPHAQSVSSYGYTPSTQFDQWSGFGGSPNASDPQVQSQVPSNMYYTY